MKKLTLAVALTMAGLAPTLGTGAALTTGADFLLVSGGARADAMGHAFSAVADDINALSFNPAGLASIKLPEAGYSRESFVSDVHFDFVGIAIPAGPAGVFGLAYQGMGTDPFNSTANTSAPLVSALDKAFTLGWGKSFDCLQVGVAAKYIDRQIGTATGNGFGFDLGLRYCITQDLTVAGSVLNMGPGIQFTTLESLPTVLDFGAAYKFHDDSVNSLTLAADSIFNLTTATQRYGIGAEYWYKDILALRTGYLFNTTTSDEGFSAGVGVKVSVIEIDYAFLPLTSIGSVHRFSALLSWNGDW